MSVSSFYICGTWESSPHISSIHNPYSGQRVGQLYVCGPEAVDRSLAFAHSSLPELKKIPVYEIVVGLRELYELLLDAADDCAACICQESGKPLTLAVGEVHRGLSNIQEAIAFASALPASMLSMTHVEAGKHKKAFSERFAKGVVVGVAPFNFPLNLVLHKFLPALLGKNAFILKPSPRTPLTALFLAKLVDKTSLHKGFFQVCPCQNHDVVSQLLKDRRVVVVSFTGSADVAEQIQALVPTTDFYAECGGIASVLIHDDAVVLDAVKAVIAGGFSYAGQTCISVQHVFIHDGIYDSVKKALLKVVPDIVYGDCLDSTVLMSSLISLDAVKRVQRVVSDAVSEGASVLCGHQVDDGVYLPTILEGVSADMSVFTEEIFGPVLCLHRYDDISEPCMRLNGLDFGLQHAVFTQSLSVFNQVYQDLEVGALLVNESPTWRLDGMPYGGIKRSGNTKEGVRYAYETFTYEKVCVLHLNA